jgi:hypothetical protein
MITYLMVLMMMSWRVQALEPEQIAGPEQEVEKSSPTIQSNLKRENEDAALRRFQYDVVRIIGSSVSDRDYPRLAHDQG